MQCPVMGWHGIDLGKERKDKEHAMPQNLSGAIAVVGIDIGKELGALPKR